MLYAILNICLSVMKKIFLPFFLQIKTIALHPETSTLWLHLQIPTTKTSVCHHDNQLFRQTQNWCQIYCRPQLMGSCHPKACGWRWDREIHTYCYRKNPEDETMQCSCEKDKVVWVLFAMKFFLCSTDSVFIKNTFYHKLRTSAVVGFRL